VILPGLRNSQRVVVKGTVDPFCVSLESVASEPCRTTIRNLQVILMTGRVLALTTLLACGCGDRAHKPAAIDVEAQRKAAEKAARAQRFEELLGSGKKALEAKRFDEAVKDLEEAVRLKDEPQARELLAQAKTAREEARKAAYDQAMLRGGQARKERNLPAAVA